MRTWQEEHDDPTTEPYTVLHIRNAGEIKFRVVERDGEQHLITAETGLFRFHVFYRTYRKRTWIAVDCRDELEAFMRADKELTRRKLQSDRRRAKLTSTS